MINLFVSVCLAIAHGQCAPEVKMPILFDDVDACTTFVRDELDEDTSTTGPVFLAFRCAAEA